MANRAKMMGLALGFCFFGVITAWGYPADSTLPEIPSQGDSTRRFALLIGIDKYRSSTIPRLEGCKNDVQAMKSVLIGRYRFPEKNVHVLLDEQATYANIVHEIKSFLAANATRPGDIVVIHYSGHGSRSPDPKAPSGTEETIVPYDSRDQQNLDITAKAFSSMLKVLAQKTKNITVILDSCNSGRIVKTRGGMVTTKVRSIADAKSAPPEPPSWTDGVRGMDDSQSKLSPLDDSYVLLAAALAKENAKEYSIGSQHYGVFSYFLTRALQTASPDASYRDVMGPVKLQVIDSVDDETPQLVGPNQDHQLFGARVKDAIPYLLVMPDSQPGKVKLPYAGEPHGITSSSIYDVYSSNVEKFELPAKPIAQIEIEQVNPDSSTGKIVTGGPVPDYSRAVLHELRLSNRKLRVWIQRTPHSDVLDSIASLIKSFPRISLVENQEAANLLVYEDKDKDKDQVMLGTPDGIPLSVPRPADSSSALDIGQQILKWASWFYILSMESRDSDLDIELSITSENAPDKDREPGPELAAIRRADNVFLAGEKAIVTIKNKSYKTVYVTLLIVSSDRTIYVLLPDRAEQGAAVELQPGASISPRIPPRAFVPRCLSSTRDTFKVIATSNPVDLRILEQTKSVCDDKPRSASDLSDLQHILNLITRGWHEETGAWTSVRKVVEVQPRKTAIH
jgi:hypothetical protein